MQSVQSVPSLLSAPSLHSGQSGQSVQSGQPAQSLANGPSGESFRSSESEESEGSCEPCERIEIPSESEIYICGYGFRRTNESAWMSVRFDLSHMKEVAVGCVDGKTRPDFRSLNAQFFGIALPTMNEVVMTLTSSPSQLVLSLSSETQTLFERALDVDSAYFGAFGLRS